MPDIVPSIALLSVELSVPKKNSKCSYHIMKNVHRFSKTNQSCENRNWQNQVYTGRKKETVAADQQETCCVTCMPDIQLWSTA